MEDAQQSTHVEPVGFPGANPVPQNPQKKSWKWLLVLILFLIVIGGVTFFVFKSSKNSTLEESPTPQATTESTETSTPQPTPSSSPADKTQVSIQVLNG